MNVRFLLLAAAISIAPAALSAQTAPSAPSSPAQSTTRTPTPGQRNHNINQRKGYQQQRIANGLKNGKLTASQTSRLEHQQAGVNREERGMRAQDNGRLTKQDRQTLHRQQNQESRRIYRDKHSGQ